MLVCKKKRSIRLLFFSRLLGSSRARFSLCSESSPVRRAVRSLRKIIFSVHSFRWTKIFQVTATFWLFVCSTFFLEEKKILPWIIILVPLCALLWTQIVYLCYCIFVYIFFFNVWRSIAFWDVVNQKQNKETKEKKAGEIILPGCVHKCVH